MKTSEVDFESCSPLASDAKPDDTLAQKLHLMCYLVNYPGSAIVFISLFYGLVDQNQIHGRLNLCFIWLKKGQIAQYFICGYRGV